MHAPGFCSPAVMKSEPLAWWQRQTSACACVALNRPTVKHRRREGPIRDMVDSTLYIVIRVMELLVRFGGSNSTLNRRTRAGDAIGGAQVSNADRERQL